MSPSVSFMSLTFSGYMLELNHKNYHLLLLFTCQVIAYNLLHYKL